MHIPMDPLLGCNADGGDKTHAPIRSGFSTPRQKLPKGRKLHIQKEMLVPPPSRKRGCKPGGKNQGWLYLSSSSDPDDAIRRRSNLKEHLSLWQPFGSFDYR
ncbi:hypothetical protein H0G86_012597 [Trichoderma simmonsii]|uniref:Uncharacterized protein n=1 Tax=Trichoderma simmonsii TaxID=1491479 RepID=A0A8G0LNT7_9HYPO|nr:hypothetical protein H0G86_012597 [Trichoderma simmonsii]